MVRKKILAVLVYVLACCVFVSACSFTVKEETEQSSEKKSGKKKKSKDKKEKKESTKSEEETEKESEKAEQDTEREALKEQIVEALDTFLLEKEPIIYLNIESDGKKAVLSESRFEMDTGTLYFVSMQNFGSEDVMTLLTDGDVEYSTKNHFGDTPWEKNEEEKYTQQLVVSINYIVDMKFVYAALDAGLDYTYLPDEKVYMFEADRDMISDLDMNTIVPKLKNADKLSPYNNRYSAQNELSIKSFPEEMGIVLKKYKFTVSDNKFEFTEILYDKDGKEIKKMDAVQLKISPYSEENKGDMVEMFKDLKRQDTGN